MQELESCQWYCKPCDTKLGKIIPTIVRPSDQVASVDNRVRTVEQEISVCSDKVDKVADSVDKRVTDIDSHVGKMMKICML